MQSEIDCYNAISEEGIEEEIQYMQAYVSSMREKINIESRKEDTLRD